MFKDTQATRLDAWSVVEESDALPALGYPALIGSGGFGIGLDAAGLQSLPDRLAAHYRCWAAPWHSTQSDLYILRSGLVSSHLWEDEIAFSGSAEFDPATNRYGQRNFMPLGYLTQELAFGSRTIAGDELRAFAGSWRRDWDLRTATVRTSYSLNRRGVLPKARPGRLTLEAFAPHGGETVFLKLHRAAAASAVGDFEWNVRLVLQTRHGLPLFDQPGAIDVRARTLVASITPASRFKPSEPYTIVYGIAAEGMSAEATPEGLTATMRGPLASEQTAWLRLDFRRLAGSAVERAPQVRAELESELEAFDRAGHERARAAHIEDFRAFWARTADIEVEAPNEYEVRRHFLHRMSAYLLRCGDDHALGGTVQFLLNHQNGWAASNFHDHHYIIDGVARANLWTEAEAHARWMARVMRPSGRPFPWMLTYNGEAVVPPERDRAPMSDANRALLAMRLFELAGRDRLQLLREAVYPILRRVADYSLAECFFESDGELLLRGVETDVMGEEPRPHFAATVILFMTVIRKAVDYAARLGVDPDRQERWRAALARIRLPVLDGRYPAWRGAASGQHTTDWFAIGNYLAETGEYLDDAAFRNSRREVVPGESANPAWFNSALASSEIRLGRPDRAEAFMADTIECRTYGPGYFQEMSLVGHAALPPFETAHGAFLTAACEQVVLPDFWRPRVFVGRGMPADWRRRRVSFSSLRGPGGVLISGVSEPRRLVVRLAHTGDPMELEAVFTRPVELTGPIRVLRDGRPVEFALADGDVTVKIDLTPDSDTELRVENEQ